ncbi:thiamine pyrophosphate-dependent enzyme [Methanohalobium sp.]|uniref:thiamine pyrophosphate-dependent enzyme n=1 Tax=Methanohalobium sp. TaxID=2837493 RepID=UPI0025E4E108|nr:thiamine pyrophosphate-dependent enzyme [Methanohalobium sp.]
MTTDNSINNTDTVYTGLDALFSAVVDSGVKTINGVAGFPVTEIMQKFLDNQDGRYNARWVTNEKTGLEIVLGSSISRHRSLMITKHVGMNVLSDPLITSTTHSIGSGVVIITGDDPEAVASQNEQDSRWYGNIVEVPVYDPSTPENAYLSIRKAFETSEKIKAPAIVRITDRLNKSKGSEDFIKNKRQFQPEPQKSVFDRSIWELTMHGRHQKYHLEKFPVLTKETEDTDLNTPTIKDSEVGIISSGTPSNLIDKILDKPEYNKFSHFSLNMVYPLPNKKLKEFIKNHDRILVIEESEPIIENQINIFGNVYGKTTGHVPYGKINAEHIEFALDYINKDSLEEYTKIQTLENRGYRGFCEGCFYIPLYQILRKLDVKVAADMGCSILGAPEPMKAIDVDFALGSAIGTACGFNNKGIAVIGDFGLAHSGLMSLINAVYGGFDVLVIVLQNEVAAMTGGQDTPDLTDVVKSIVNDVSIYSINDKTEEDIKKSMSELINDKLNNSGVSVILAKGKCVKYR